MWGEMSALLAELAGRLLSGWGANTNHREMILRYTAQDLNREGILLLETYSYSATVLLCFSALRTFNFLEAGEVSFLDRKVVILLLCGWCC